MSGTNQSFLIDTNIFAAAQRQDAVVINQLVGINVLLSAIVLGELYFGARNSSRVDVNFAIVDQLAQIHPILNCDHTTANYYSSVKRALRLKGHPIPENDIWIAAQALQYNVTLVTRDAHFQQIDSLKIATW